MDTQEPRWLHIGIDDDQAIKLLDELAKDAKLRKNLEANPRRVMFRRFRIDFPAAPATVKLPPPEEIARYANELRKEQPFGRDFNLAHGIVLLWVAHGNGFHPPPAAARARRRPGLSRLTQFACRGFAGGRGSSSSATTARRWTSNSSSAGRSHASR